MTHVTCRLTAKNRDQLRNPTLCCWVWATFTFFTTITRLHSWWGMHVTGGNERGRMFGRGAQHRWSNFDHSGCMAGFVSCKKKNRNAKNMASAGARAYMEVCGRCPQRGPGQSPWWGGQGGEAPPEAEGILLPKRANLNIIHYWFIKFCSYIPKRTGTAFRWSKKELERRSGAFRLETNPGVHCTNTKW